MHRVRVVSNVANVLIFMLRASPTLSPNHLVTEIFYKCFSQFTGVNPFHVASSSEVIADSYT